MKTNFYLGNKQRFTAQNEMFQQSCCIVHDDTIGQNALDHHSECFHSKQPISRPWINQQIKLNYLCYVKMSFPTSQASNERPSRCWLQDEFQVPTFINPWNHSELRRQPTQVYHQDCYGVCYNMITWPTGWYFGTYVSFRSRPYLSSWSFSVSASYAFFSPSHDG